MDTMNVSNPLVHRQLVTMVESDAQELPGHLKSKFPVLLPVDHALLASQLDFEDFLHQTVKSDAAILVAHQSSQTSLVIHRHEVTAERPKAGSSDETAQRNFMQALHESNKPSIRDMKNVMRTENDDLAYRSTNSPLVDLFTELEEVVEGPRLAVLLGEAWKVDADVTLKIVFNARSIHLGKGSHVVAYKCFGWLAKRHPLTLLLNLRWLTRPIIEKKRALSGEETEDDMVIVDTEQSDVQNGVAHGYWKDLLNILVLAAHDKLDGLADPSDILNVDNRTPKRNLTWDENKAKEVRDTKKTDRYNAVLAKLNNDPFFRALHLTVARLFAEQLGKDLALLRSDKPAAARRISLCGKWAPSLCVFHDKNTFITSSIAEILHSRSEFPAEQDRETYLRNAREAYRKDISALRKALEVVEREITAQRFENVKYDHVPSHAMNQYASLFARKDTERFDKYIDSVAQGKKQISGATLLPSTLIAAVRRPQSQNKARKGAKRLVEEKMRQINARVIDAQWNTLVKRVKDNGSLNSSLAICDVSGSMGALIFKDITCPMDSSIGLSLLLAEITSPPFGGGFVTFSSRPRFQEITGDTLHEKVKNMEQADWGASTDFVAVFTKLILPMARTHNLTQDQMVKQVFVFSDMQFNSAEYSAGPNGTFTTSYERIKTEFELYGYEMPRLIFWNLAAGARAGQTGASKPVTADEHGTALVSGYSQGMLRVFLDTGGRFDADEVEETVIEKEDGDGLVTVEVSKKVKMDPLGLVMKAVSHRAYSILRVYD